MDIEEYKRRFRAKLDKMSGEELKNLFIEIFDLKEKEREWYMPKISAAEELEQYIDKVKKEKTANEKLFELAEIIKNSKKESENKSTIVIKIIR